MNKSGYSLMELLITLCVLAITLTLSIPSFSNYYQKSQLESTYQALFESIQAARTQAVLHNQRAILKADKNWGQGWQLFLDPNNNGVLDLDERVILKYPRQANVKIVSNTPVSSYISFIGTGEGRKLSTAKGGGFLSGTIKICPKKKGEGYSLVLSKGGRTRVAKLTATECDAISK